MHRKIYSRAIVCMLTLAMLLTFTGLKKQTSVYAAYTRYVTADTLSIREKASASSKKLGAYKKGTKITCYGSTGNWTEVKNNGKTAYVCSSYLSSTKPSATSQGQQVVNYAKKFIGNPYRYGGTSLTNGIDCSGFTQAIYRHFGYSIPRTSGEQRSAGKKVSWSNKKPGDLICYYGHVAIYAGNNTVVHASSKKTGIKTTSPANYRSVASVRRIVK